jgi:23S rRNA (pseudouridine1915-N3)-methyltransferase
VNPKLHFVKFGRYAFDKIDPMVQIYFERLNKFESCQQHIIKDPQSQEFSGQLAKKIGRDGAKAGSAPCQIICFDERGQKTTSPKLAHHLENWLAKSAPIALVIGGPYGIPNWLLEKSTAQISLSDMVLTSDMAWLLLHEQIYRSYTINKGMPYHHA